MSRYNYDTFTVWSLLAASSNRPNKASTLMNLTSSITVFYIFRGIHLNKIWRSKLRYSTITRIWMSDICCLYGSNRHQNVKLTFRILFLVNFNLFGAAERSEKWEVVLCCWYLCCAWDGGREERPSQPVSDVRLVTVATQWSRPVLTSSMINNESQICLFIISPPVSQSVSQSASEWQWYFIDNGQLQSEAPIESL